MKAIIALLVVQTGILLLLAAKISTIEHNSIRAVSPADHSVSGGGQSVSPRESQLLRAPADMSESRLREIIREELAAHAAAPLSREPNEQQAASVDVAYSAEDQFRLERVNQRLDYFESIGDVPRQDIQDLQAEIARLHEADRQRTLNRLFESMNEGRIKGLL